MGETRHARGASGAALAFVATTLVLAPVAFASMFSIFNAYDDEGYFLITLRDYISGHPLVGDVWAIYGPFFYEVMGGTFKLLGLNVSTDSGRAVTLVVWLMAAAIAGVATLRLTRSLLLAVSAQFVAFHALAGLRAEPMQPSGLLSLLLISVVAVAAFGSVRPRLTAVLLGSLVAAAALVKVNAGVFASLAVAFAFAAGIAGRWRRPGLVAMGVVLIAAPFALMSGLLGRDWVLEYALEAGVSIAAICVALFAATPRAPSFPSVPGLAVGFAATAAVCLGIAILGGTHLEDLFKVLVANPLRVPDLFVWPVRIGWVNVVWALLSLAAATVFARRRATWAIPALARIAAGAFTLLAILLVPSSLFFMALPLAWLATQDPNNGTGASTDQYARLLLPVLAVMESLQAYPIAGTQLSIAALTMVPVGAIILSDGIRQLQVELRTGSPRRLRLLAAATAPAALIVNLAFYQLFAFFAFTDYGSTQPLGLPGAAVVRVAPGQAAALRALAARIDANCSSFITMPGMASLYLWTNREPPAQAYLFWMFALDSAQQAKVLDDVQDRPGMCVVKNQAVLDFWAEGRAVPLRPLVDYIDAAFIPDQVFGDYELLVRR